MLLTCMSPTSSFSLFTLDNKSCEATFNLSHSSCGPDKPTIIMTAVNVIEM